MRIFLLSSTTPVRGVLRSLANLGVEPVVPRPNGDNETDGLVRFVRVAARGDVTDARDLRWSRRGLRAMVRDVGPELIHLAADPWTPTAEAGAAAARDLKIPYTLVGNATRGGPTGLTSRWQADRIRQGAAGLAGTVRPALDYLVGDDKSPRPTAVLPPGGVAIPAPWSQRPDPEPVIIAVVGRLVAERGLDLLLDALGTIAGEWRLRVIGTGPVQEALEAQAQRLGLSARIEWLGAQPRDRLPAFWREVDVLAVPSRSTSEWTEPTGAVVLQAMANGVAPVVSRCGALPDVVADSGLVIEEQDVAGLTRALSGLVAEPWRCRAIGNAARQRVLEQYGDGAVAERMVQFWRKTLAAR
ncbi:MAG TPA: glycosyltransferase family 4 protein [Gemmatimonadales bacterium]